MTIKMRILLPMILFTIVASSLILISDIFQFSSYVTEDMSNRLSMAAMTALSEIDNLKIQTNAASLYLAKDPYIIRALEEGVDAALLQRAVKLNANTGVEFCNITDTQGIIRVSTHDMSLHGIDGTVLPSIASALSGRHTTTIERGITVPLAVSTTTPIYSESGEFLGTVLTGFPLDSEKFVDSIKSVTDCEVSICRDDGRISTTIKLDDGTRAIGTKSPSDISRYVLAGNIYSGKVQILSDELISKYYPLFAVDGSVVGMLFVGHYTNEATDAIGTFVRTGLLFMLGCTALFVVVILYISGHIVKPITEANTVLRQISKGDFEARVVGNYKGDLKLIKDSVNNTAMELSLYLKEKVEAERIAHESELEKARAVEATNVKSEFLAAMSHEIRTPMNAIVGMSELLAEEALNTTQREYVRSIESSAAALLTIINDILDMTKIESGKFTLISVDFLFEPFITNIASVIEYGAEIKGITFILDTDDSLPECLLADDIRLRQILLNLLSNAIKFTDDGTVTLTVRYNDGVLRFSVEDTGIGIRESDISRLFDSFEQLDAPKNRHRQGTGLGLPITKSLIEAMGGQLTVNSVYGEGTTFSVGIPIPQGDKKKAASEANAQETLSAPEAVILLVDDNEANLNVGRGLLGLSDINCDTACNGAEAIRMVREKDYDIVFMDHMMPGMDGVEATAQIRAMGGKYEKLVIIALTANAMSEAREMFLSSGLDDFLAKPIERALLINILKKWLPPEKVQISIRATAESAQINDNENLRKIGQFEEIDVNKGLGLTSGSEELYESTLRIVTKRMKESTEAMAGFLENNELDRFAITVHGIKSSLATAGAVKLSEQAQELETMALGGELKLCKHQYPGFSKALLVLYDKLSDVFSDDVQEPKEAGSTSELRPRLNEIRRYLDEFDDESALDILAGLRGFDFGEEINSLIKTLCDQIEIFDYDSADITAESIERMCE